LVNAQTDSHLWAETYDRKLTDVFSDMPDLKMEMRLFTYPIAWLTAFDSATHRRPNGSASEIRSTPRLSLRRRTS